MEHNNVFLAFEKLLEEIEENINELNHTGSETFKKGQYDEAKKLIEEAKKITGFRKSVKDLQSDWVKTFLEKTKVPKVRGKKYPRIRRGLRTPDDAFRLPILESLVELGGSGTLRQVLIKVEDKMKNVLNEYDFQPLPSLPHELRWRNTAAWCRNTLVNEGLMRSDSPRGLWEISDEGRGFLKKKI